MQVVGSVTDVADLYEAMFADLWGVVHDGRRAFPAAVAAMRAWRATGRPIVLLSNVPRPGANVAGTFARLGLPVDAWDDIVTSGDAIRPELARRAPGPVYRMGRQTDAGLWDGLGLRFSDLADARFAAIAGLPGHPGEHPDDYLAVLRDLRERDLELVCANPDVQVPHGIGLRWSPGSIASRYEALGGPVVQAGKPHAPIYELAFERAARILGHDLAASRVLAVGDGPATDVRGAMSLGIDALFIATGINGTGLLAADGAVSIPAARAMLAEDGLVVRWVQARFS